MVSEQPRSAGRAYLESEVAARARHDTAEEVRTSCSFARAERLLGREYHGRFLVELLQNAADAWRSDSRSHDGRSRVAVILGEGPALLVANQGSAMTPEVVIESLGHIGASTKSEGEAIGHKGIGFKSVLEVTLAPEIYSGLQGDEPGLAVSFDPHRARASIMDSSPRWEEHLRSVQGSTCRTSSRPFRSFDSRTGSTRCRTRSRGSRTTGSTLSSGSRSIRVPLNVGG